MPNACAASSHRERNYLTSVDRRVAALERKLKFVEEITGICTTGVQAVTPVIAINQDSGTGVFTLTWTSAEGERFQVQTSTDAVTWTVEENSVDAAVSPAVITEFDTSAYALFEDTPRYFRVRKYPRLITACTPPTDPCPTII